MPEIREVTSATLLPDDIDWVVINRVADKFSAVGFSMKAQALPFFTPSPFDTLDAALEVSGRWATENDVPVIYVNRHPRLG